MLPTEVLEDLVARFSPINCHQDQILFEEGDEVRGMYFVLDGNVQLFIENKEGREVIVSDLQSGSHFGEVALLTNPIINYSARATTHSQLLLLSRKDFSMLTYRHPIIPIQLNKVLSERLYTAYQVISSKTTNKIIVLLADEQNKLVDHCIEYFYQISQKSVFMGSMPVSELNKRDRQKRGEYIIIVRSRIEPELKQRPLTIISFMKQFQREADYTIDSQTDGIPQIEKIVRKIANKTVGIALSSGTAPGLAHLGVMKKFREENIPIDYISGTSGGALYGAPFAFNIPWEIIYATFSNIYKKPLYRLWDFSYNRKGIFLGTRLIKKTIGLMMPDLRIEDSHIPFAVAASELHTAQERLLVNGNLAESIRASLSIPILFTPVQQPTTVLVDGVITTPVPVNALEQAKIDIKMACYVPQANDTFQENFNMVSIFLRSRNMTADKKAMENMENTHIIIRPEVSMVSQFEYKRIDEIINRGETAAQAVIPRIKKMLYGKK